MKETVIYHTYPEALHWMLLHPLVFLEAAYSLVLLADTFAIYV